MTVWCECEFRTGRSFRLAVGVQNEPHDNVSIAFLSVHSFEVLIARCNEIKHEIRRDGDSHQLRFLVNLEVASVCPSCVDCL